MGRIKKMFVAISIGMAIGIIPLQTFAGELTFPDSYSEEEDNVMFQCEIHLPENFDISQLHTLEVEQVYSSDHLACLEYLAKDKIVQEEQIYPRENDMPEWHYYTFQDGSVLGNGNSTFYISPVVSYYNNAFYYLSQKAKDDQGTAFDFLSLTEAENRVDDIKNKIGLLGDVSFSGYGLSFEEAKSWEEHLNQDGGYAEELYKQDWSAQDNAYLIYGYQLVQRLPVYHELMFIGGGMKYVTPDNAPVQAIYTANGIERLQINYLYQFKISDNLVELQPFEEVAGVVSAKLNSILSEEIYEVKDATLMQMVRHSQSQKYETFPVWYFEVTAESGTQAVVVDAVRAEEVYIP